MANPAGFGGAPQAEGAPRAFLRAHEDHITLHKLRHGKPLTASDFAELEAMLLDAGIGNAGAVAMAKETSDGFGTLRALARRPRSRRGERRLL